MQPEEWDKCKAKMGGLKHYFEELDSGFSVKENLAGEAVGAFDRKRGASFWFEPKGGGRSLLVRLDLEILMDYDVGDIIRLMEKSKWQLRLGQIPEGCYLHFEESGAILIHSFRDLPR